MNGSIQWEIENANSIPRFICDACKRPIENTTLANVEWRDFKPHEGPFSIDTKLETYPLGEQPWRTVHKAAFCSEAADQLKQEPWAGCLWEDLNDWLRYLIGNTLSDEDMRLAGIELHAMDRWDGKHPHRGGKRRNNA